MSHIQCSHCEFLHLQTNSSGRTSFLPSSDLAFISPYASAFNCMQEAGSATCPLVTKKKKKREHQINPMVIQDKVVGMGY